MSNCDCVSCRKSRDRVGTRDEATAGVAEYEAQRVQAAAEGALAHQTFVARHARIIADATKTPDPANPGYYKRGGIASADVIDAWQLGPWEAMVLKYLLRAKFKGDERDDLRKAAWCLERARGRVGT